MNRSSALGGLLKFRRFEERPKMNDLLEAPQALEAESPSRRSASNLGRVLCLAGATLGAIGLFGWIARMPLLTTIVPGEPQMMANTALSLLLVGVAAAVRGSASAPLLMRLVTGGAAAIVLAIGIGTLAEYASGVDLGIDQLLATARPGRYPGRPSPPTAAALASLSGALLAFDSRPRARIRPSEWMILSAGLVGFIALVGASFGAGPLYRLRSAPITGVAVPTAVSLLLISAGMLLERPAAGIAGLATSSGPAGALLRRLALPALVVPVLLGLALSRLFAAAGIQDVALLFATLVGAMTVVGLVLMAGSAAPLDHAHQALAASRLRMRELLQHAPDAVFIADLEGRYTDVNRAGCEMLGLTRDEIVGKTIVDLIPPEDVARLGASRQRLLRGGAEISEWRLRRKDGTYVPVELNAKILADGRWQAFVRDITERKRAEGALRASEARYAGLVSIAADAIISIDERQQIIIFNQGAEKIFGWSAAEALGKPLETLIPQRYRDRHRQHIREFAAQRETARPMGGRGIAGLRKNGEEFPAEAAISKLQVQEGTVFTVVLRDVTEQRRAANEERFLARVGAVLGKSIEYEETLSNVARLGVEELADVCIVECLDADDGIRRVTVDRRDPSDARVTESHHRTPVEAARLLLRASDLETAGSLVVSDVEPETLTSIASDDESCRVLRTLAPKSLVALPLVTQGRIAGALILLRTTPSRAYASRDLFLAQELSRRATLALENARLYRVARNAVRARDDVLGIVAHDLRNPLTGIRMQAQVIQRSAVEQDVKSRGAAERIESAAARMNRLIEDLLDVTRIEAGHLSIAPSRQATAKLVSEVVQAQRDLAAAASVEVRFEPAPEVPDVMADRDRLIQVFENLIGNAIKFAPSESHIVVGAGARGSDVLFHVTDDGPGIPSDAGAHLFDRFWQVKRADRRGAGLGLPIVKGIVEAHGGRIWVETASGRGTTFFFTIPAA